MNKDKDGKSRGFGLVEFRDRAAADQAVLCGHASWSIERRKFQPSGGTFLSSTNRSHRLAVDSKQIQLHPHDIRFTHGRISFCFKDGKSVDETIDKCIAGTVRFEDAPPLQVVQNPGDGCYYSLSNRRLFVARVLSSKGIRFGLQRESDTVEVRLFPFSNQHVQSQWQLSCRTLAHGGRFAVPAWRCGACKQRHMSKYIEEQVVPKFLGELRSGIDKEAERRETALLNAIVTYAFGAMSDDDINCDFD